MSDLWVYELGTARGREQVNVEALVREFGPVRDGFLERTGFETLFRCGAEEDALSLAVAAAGGDGDHWWRESVDAIVSVSSTTRLVAPGNAHLLQSALRLPTEVLTLDINDACTGFLRGMHLVHSLIASGSAKTVLFATADTYSRLYRPSNLRVSPLFSDGGSAFIVSNERLPQAPDACNVRHWRLLSTAFLSEGKNAAELSITRDGEAGTRLGELEMNGAGVLNFVLRHLPTAIKGLTGRAGVELADIDTWYVHQGSRTVVAAAEKALQRPRGSLFRSETYGNMVGSSLPFQLADDAVSSRAGMVLGLLAFGVGLTIAGTVVEQLAIPQ